MKHAITAILVAALSSIPLHVHAQQYPTKPITLIVPYGPGGAADQAGRLIALAAAKHLPQAMVVVNRGGANGVVGSLAVLNAEKDGHTLLLARIGSQAVGPAMDPSTPYTWNSFTILGMLELDPYICVVNSKSPIRTIPDLVKALRDRPGKLNYFASGPSDTTVVFAVKIFLNAGLKTDIATPIIYKGGGETMAALLAEQVDFGCGPLAAYIGAIRGGRARGIVVSTAERVTEAPDIPTAREAGMPDLETVTGWSALYGPPGLPRHVIDRWASILQLVRNDPEWNERVRGHGALPGIMTPAETTRFVEAQFNSYRALAPQLSRK